MNAFKAFFFLSKTVLQRDLRLSMIYTGNLPSKILSLSIPYWADVVSQADGLRKSFHTINDPSLNTPLEQIFKN